MGNYTQNTAPDPPREVQAIVKPNGQFIDTTRAGFLSVVVIMFTSHTKGPWFDPRQKHTSAFPLCRTVKLTQA